MPWALLEFGAYRAGVLAEGSPLACGGAFKATEMLLVVDLVSVDLKR